MKKQNKKQVAIENPNNWPLTKKGVPYNPEMMDENGKFIKGNKAGTNSFNARYHEIRTLIMYNVTNDDVKDIVVRAVDDAKKGDAEARKWLFDRLIGKAHHTNEATDTNNWQIVINVSDKQPREVINTTAKVQE